MKKTLKSLMMLLLIVPVAVVFSACSTTKIKAGEYQLTGFEIQGQTIALAELENVATLKTKLQGTEFDFTEMQAEGYTIDALIDLMKDDVVTYEEMAYKVSGDTIEVSAAYGEEGDAFYLAMTGSIKYSVNKSGDVEAKSANVKFEMNLDMSDLLGLDEGEFAIAVKMEFSVDKDGKATVKNFSVSMFKDEAALKNVITKAILIEEGFDTLAELLEDFDIDQETFNTEYLAPRLATFYAIFNYTDEEDNPVEVKTFKDFQDALNQSYNDAFEDDDAAEILEGVSLLKYKNDKLYVPLEFTDSEGSYAVGYAVLAKK